MFTDRRRAIPSRRSHWHRCSPVELGLIAAAVALGGALSLAGCPGEIEDPEPFLEAGTDGGGTGGTTTTTASSLATNTNAGGDGGAGGAGGW